MANPQCPSREVLRDWATGSLDDKTADSVLDHVDTCEACERKLDEIERGGLLQGVQSLGAASGFANESQCLSFVGGLENKTLILGGDAADSTCPRNQADLDTSFPNSRSPSRAIPVDPQGNFRIEAELARGGMGSIYTGRDLQLDRAVAIKTLLPHADAARFVTESKITAKLPHPNVPPVYALGELADGSPFLAMKLVRGETFHSNLEARKDVRQHLPKFLQIFEQVAQAVGFAHSKGIIHRDLKPANVMVGAFGEVQVMDWGLAKDGGQPEASVAPTVKQVGELETVSPSETFAIHTVAGEIMGTPSFMAPEQARGEPVDARADVFSLGCILTKILTGELVFKGRNALQVVSQAASGDTSKALESLSSCGADAELVDIAISCLEVNANDRPEDGSAVAKLVADYGVGVETRLRQAESDRAAAEAKAIEQQKRRRVVQIGAGAVATVLLLGIIGTTWGLVVAEKSRAKEATQRKIAVVAQQRATDLATAEQLANKAAQAAKTDAETAALEAQNARDSEVQAKKEAFRSLTQSYTNLGFVEAEKQNFSEAQLWFANAAAVQTDPEVRQVQLMRAWAHGRRGVSPVSVFIGRKPKRSPESVFTEHQLELDPSNRFLSYRLLHTEPVAEQTQDPLLDEYVLLDLKEERDCKLAGSKPASKLRAVGFSPRGEMVATSIKEGEVELRRLPDLKVIKTLRLDEPGAVTVLQFNETGKLLFVGSSPACIYDVDADSFLKVRMRLPTRARRAAFLENGEQVLCSTHVINGISYYQYTETYLFPLEGDGSVAPLEGNEVRAAVKTTQIDLDESANISIPNTGETLNRYRLEFKENGRVTRRLSPLPIDLGRITVSPDGQYVACIGGREGLVATYRIYRDSRWSVTTQGDARPIFSADGRYVFVLGEEPDSLTVRTSANGKAIGEPLKLAFPIRDAVFTPDSTVIAVAAAGPTEDEPERYPVQFWNWQKRELVGKPVLFSEPLISLAFHPKEDWLAVATRKAIVQLNRQPPAMKELITYPFQNPDYFKRVFFTQSGRWLVHSADKMTWAVGFKNLENGEYKADSWGKNGREVIVSAGGDRLLVVQVTPKQVPWLYDMSTYTAVEPAIPKTNIYPQGHISPDGTRALIYGEGSYLAVYDVESEPRLACPLIQPLVQNGRVLAEFIHGTPYVVAYTYLNGAARLLIYEQVTGKLICPPQILPGHLSKGLWVSPNGRTIVLEKGPTELAFFDVSYLHHNPFDSLYVNEVLDYASVQACASIEDGRIATKSPLEAWRRLRQSPFNLTRFTSPDSD